MGLIAWLRAIRLPSWLSKAFAALGVLLALRQFWRHEGAKDQINDHNEARLKSVAAAKKDLDDAQNTDDDELAVRLTRNTDSLH